MGWKTEFPRSLNWPALNKGKMTAKILRGFILLIIGALFVIPSLNAQEKKGSAEKPVWKTFGSKKSSKEEKKVKVSPGGNAKWKVFGATKSPELEKKIKAEAAEKDATIEKEVKPKGPPPKPVPKLTVEKEDVDQEEFVFPDVVTPAVTKKEPTTKKETVEETGEKPVPSKEQPKTVEAGQPDVVTTSEEVAEEESGADINVLSEDNPWIPNIIEDFLKKVREKQILVAYKVSPEFVPIIDGNHAESSWLQSPILEVPIEKGPVVKIQAIYDDQNIYFLLRWPDKAENREKGQWYFDGEKWSRQGEEDRMGIMWDIDNTILDFNVHACGITCHDTDKNKQLHKMYTNADVEFADLWDWGAATSDPLGYVEDSFLDNQKFETKGVRGDAASEIIGVAISVAKGGIHYDDSDEPGTIENTNNDNTMPIYMVDPKKVVGAKYLTEENAVPITDYTIFNKGDTIPGYLLRQLTGSRGDIEAKGRYKEGMWSLELKRKLDTGNTDDVQFDLLRTYYFGIANFNNTRQEKHTKSAKCLVRFKQKQVYAPALFFGFLSVSIIYLVSWKKHDWEEEYRMAKKMSERVRTATVGAVSGPPRSFSSTTDKNELSENMPATSQSEQPMKKGETDD